MKGVWLRPPSSKASVIFVHGILSDGETCWTNQNGCYWPELLSKEPSLESIGVYVFTYQTGVFSGSYRLSDVVDALREHMRLDGMSAMDQLIFVCHSMGGIVVRKFLVERAVDLLESQTRICLLLIASPSLGASYADWLSPLAQLFGNSQGDALRFVRGNEWLGDLDKEFKNLKEAGRLPIHGKELVEDKFIVMRGIFRRQVVEPFSGSVYFGEGYKVPGSDHFSIAKPVDRDAVQHRILVEHIQTFLQFASTDSPTRNPSAAIVLNLVDADVEALHYSPRNAELELSLTNLSREQVKLLALRLTVQLREPVRKFRLPTPGAPHREFQLTADITESDSVDLLADAQAQFILKPGESDAFSILVTAKDGYRYDVMIECECAILGRNAQKLTDSVQAKLMYPIRSVGGSQK